MKLPRLHKKGHSYYHVTGTPPRVWTPLGSDQEEAIRLYHAIERGQKPAAKKDTVGYLISEFLRDPRRKWTAGTVSLYGTWACHLSRVFGHLRPDEIERVDVLEYLDRCPRTSGSGEISLLRQVLERAVRQRQATSNPCVGAKAESRQRSERTRYVSDAELAAVRAKASPLLAVAIDLAYLTALRVGDLCRARFDDFAEHIETQKTGARLRFLMTDELRSVLDAGRALQGRVASLTVLSERGQPVNRWRVGNLWRQACKAAGVKDAQFRDIRAKSASDDPDQAQQRLGHASAQTTRTYMRGRRISEVQPTKRVVSN